MKLKLPCNGIVKSLLAISLLAMFSSCNSFETPVHTGEKIMSELTKTMHPICLGRLTIEIPDAFVLEHWQYEVDYIKINSVSPPSLNQKAFVAKVDQLEKKLKTSPHKAEGVRMKSKMQLTPERVLFIYRDKENEINLYELESPIWQSNVEYQFKTTTTNKYLDSAINRITQISKSFVAIPNLNPSNAPAGFCLENGVLTDTSKSTEFRGEDISVKGSIENYPGLEFEFSASSTNRKDEDPTLLDRIDQSFNFGDAIGIAIKNSSRFIRKGKRNLNGQSGEEFVLINKLDGEINMDASAEFYGEPNVLNKPYTSLSITYRTPTDSTQTPKSKTLTEKEFVALWDSLLNGIRPRKNSLWGDTNKN